MVTRSDLDPSYKPMKLENTDVPPKYPDKEMLGKCKELKQAIVMRTDLGMSSGKMVAQGAHAAAAADVNKNYSVARIVLKVNSEAKLQDLIDSSKWRHIAIHPIRDAGKTEVEPGTLTCCSFTGDPKEIDKIVGHLQLL